MTEAEEVAQAMYAAYLEWLASAGKLRTKDAAREFVRAQMADESARVRENVADALYRLSGRVGGQ